MCLDCKQGVLPKVPFMRCIGEYGADWEPRPQVSLLSRGAQELNHWEEDFKLLCLNFSL